jgi:hypothetical protein
MASVQERRRRVIKLLNGMEDYDGCVITAAAEIKAHLEESMRIKGFTLKGRFGGTPLMFAAFHCPVDLVQWILQRYKGNIDSKRTDAPGLTALMWAVKGKKYDNIIALLASGANVDRLDSKKQTALFYATDSQTVELLVNAGADLNAEDCYARTVLMEAFARDDMEAFMALLLAEVDVFGGGERYGGALGYVCEGDRENAIEYAKVLLESYDADVDLRPSCRCCPPENPGLVKVARYGREELFKLLIAFGADVNLPWKVTGATALIQSCRGRPGREELVDILLATGRVNLNVACLWNKRTALMYAAHFGHVNIVRKLVDAGADVRIICKEGRAALSYALESKEDMDKEEMVKIIREAMETI